jgi:hypothetical protein
MFACRHIHVAASQRCCRGAMEINDEWDIQTSTLQQVNDVAASNPPESDGAR